MFGLEKIFGGEDRDMKEVETAMKKRDDVVAELTTDSARTAGLKEVASNVEPKFSDVVNGQNSESALRAAGVKASLTGDVQPESPSGSGAPEDEGINQESVDAVAQSISNEGTVQVLPGAGAEVGSPADGEGGAMVGGEAANAGSSANESVASAAEVPVTEAGTMSEGDTVLVDHQPDVADAIPGSGEVTDVTEAAGPIVEGPTITPTTPEALANNIGPVAHAEGEATNDPAEQAGSVESEQQKPAA